MSTRKLESRTTGMKHTLQIGLIIICIVFSGSSLVAQTKDSLPSGFYVGIPKSFYSTYSAFGLQFGYKFQEHLNLRLQYSAATYHQEGKEVWFQLPSISVIYSTYGRSFMRYYFGLTCGVQYELKNSFKKEVVFLNAMDGIEFFTSKKASVFFEIGPGIVLRVVEGAFQGGTIIEAGYRIYFK